MHLSQGYTYHLSIMQFIFSLAQVTPVYLLSLDTEAQISEFYRREFGSNTPSSLNILTIRNKRFGFRSNTLWFRLGVLRVISGLAKGKTRIAIYTRNVKLAAWLFSRLRKDHRFLKVFESHQIFSQNLAFEGRFAEAAKEFELERKLYRNADLIFANTGLLASRIKRLFGSCATVLPVAVRSADIGVVSEQQTTSRHYDFVYVGSFNEWKGVDVLLDALKHLVGQGWTGKALLIGVRPADERLMQEKIDALAIASVTDLLPRVPKDKVASLLDQARVGVIPNSLLDDSIFNTSPLKLFDYAARGLPMVISAVPALLTEINLDAVEWFVPDNSVSLAKHLELALNKYGSQTHGTTIEWAFERSWDKRASLVLGAIQRLVPKGGLEPPSP